MPPQDPVVSRLPRYFCTSNKRNRVKARIPSRVVHQPVSSRSGDRRSGREIFNHFHQSQVHDSRNIAQVSDNASTKGNRVRPEPTQRLTRCIKAAVSSAEVSLGQIAERVARAQAATLPIDLLVHIEFLNLFEA